MGDGPSQTQNQSGTESGSKTFNSSTDPWLAAQPALKGILDQISGVSGGVTPAQQAGLDAVLANAQANAGTNFGPQATAGINSLFSTNTDLPQQILTTNFGGLGTGLNLSNNALLPYLDKGYLDPMSNPGTKGVLDTLTSDITSKVNSQWAGAGRSFSGGNSLALGRGLTQGLAPVLMDQYNKNVAAQQGAAGAISGNAGLLFNSGNTLANSLAGVQQIPRNNILAAIGAIPGLPAAQNTGVQGLLDAANASYGQPLKNLAGLAAIINPIAGLGNTSAGSGTSEGTHTGSGTTETSQPWYNTAIAGLAALGGLTKNVGTPKVA